MCLARFTVLLAAMLLLAGSTLAQPVPAALDPAGAEQAAVRLVEAARARDWPALAAFVDPRDAQELAEAFPATAGEADAHLRDLLAAEGIDADSLFAAADAAGPAAAGMLSGVRFYRRLLSTFYADGPMDRTSLVARTLALTARCDPDSTVALFDRVVYVPVRADARADGTVEAVGRVSATVDGETREGLTVTPLHWTEGRWTLDRAQTEARDAEPNPVAEMVGAGAQNLMYGMIYALGSGVEGPMPACLGTVE